MRVFNPLQKKEDIMSDAKVLQQSLLRAALLCSLLTVLTACTPAQEAASDSQQSAREVSTVTIIPTDFVQTVTLPGRVEAIRQAEVRARVAGIVLHRHFTEGSDVKAGDLLFQLDPAPFELALRRAKAELAKAQASLADVQAVANRYQELVKIEAVSQQDFEAAVANLQSAKAVVQAAQVEVDTAKLQLSYTQITAPISGRIGRAMVSEGALVGQNEATQMAVIQQLNPVYVDFSQSSEQELQRQALLKQGKVTEAELLQVVDTNGHVLHEGKLLFADSRVDAATGTVRLRGEFTNPQQQLLAGMYVRVVVRQFSSTQAILIPQRAVQRSGDGQAQVWVINANDQAEPRIIQTGEMIGSQWHVLQGLAANEQVIVGGLQMLQLGEPVRIMAVAKSRETPSSDVR
jgi:multidrug efflux system membrane fusion protein